MKELRLKIHGGGRLEVHGSLDAPRILIVLSRESFRLDDALVTRLTEYFSGRRWTIAKYETRAVETTRRIDQKCFAPLPQWLRQSLKAMLLLGLPGRWRHYSPRYRIEVNSIAYRVQGLRELVKFIGGEKEIVFLTRSASGRVASLMADADGVRKLVCLGYPFKHPDAPPERARYEHLATLQTPFLIIQGTRDNYGGTEIKGRYQLGPNTKLEWVETDHGFDLSEAEWTRILGLIEGFIAVEGGGLKTAELVAR